jgi:hypothetical protein
MIYTEIETYDINIHNYLKRVFNKKFPVFDYDKIVNPNTYIHCDTEWKAKNFINWCVAVGLDIDNPLLNISWNAYEEDSCYYLCNDYVSREIFVMDKNNVPSDYNILRYEEVVFNNETQTKGENKMRKDTIVFKTDGPIYTRTTGGMQLFLKEENHKEILNKYNFRGQCNLDVIINDAIRDGKRSFIIMGKNNAIVGVLQNTFMDINDVICEVIYDEEAGEFQGASSGSEIIACPFFLKIIDKKDVNTWIKKLTEERKTFNKKILKMKDKIKKKTKNGENKGDSFTVFTIDE